MDPDAEVQGEICLAVQMLEDALGRCLRCHVLQARYGPDVGWGGGCSENERESTGYPQMPWPVRSPHSWDTPGLKQDPL